MKTQHTSYCHYHLFSQNVDINNRQKQWVGWGPWITRGLYLEQHKREDFSQQPMLRLQWKSLLVAGSTTSGESSWKNCNLVFQSRWNLSGHGVLATISHRRCLLASESKSWATQETPSLEAIELQVGNLSSIHQNNICISLHRNPSMKIKATLLSLSIVRSYSHINIRGVFFGYGYL